jgi:hypothetical protein
MQQLISLITELLSGMKGHMLDNHPTTITAEMVAADSATVQSLLIMRMKETGCGLYPATVSLLAALMLLEDLQKVDKMLKIDKRPTVEAKFSDN